MKNSSGHFLLGLIVASNLQTVETAPRLCAEIRTAQRTTAASAVLQLTTATWERIFHAKVWPCIGYTQRGSTVYVLRTAVSNNHNASGSRSLAGALEHCSQFMQIEPGIFWRFMWSLISTRVSWSWCLMLEWSSDQGSPKLTLHNIAKLLLDINWHLFSMAIPPSCVVIRDWLIP